MQPTLSLSHVLNRGVAQVLPGKDSLATLLSQKTLTVYLGIDPTGSLLHLGHAVVLRKLQQFALLGHKVILLIGNGTVRIGDPTGRDTTRPTLTDEQIEANFQTWRSQASKILDFNLIEIKRNGDWLDQLHFSEIVKLLAKTTVQQLIERDMFQDRLKKGLPIFGHEIIYPLLQGYDSVAMDVDLEIGGTDQTFNMLMGRELQKAYHNREKWVLTTPIITGTDGRKMSKSFNNYVALTENPTDMYGKLMRISDDMIWEYFNILTDVSDADIAAMQTALHRGDNPLTFKKQLALTITAGLHSQEAADQAAEHFQHTVQDKQLPTDIPTVAVASLQQTPTQLIKLALPQLSNSEIRRLIQQRAVSLLPQEEVINEADLSQTFTNGQVIKVGKRHYFIVVGQSTESDKS